MHKNHYTGLDWFRFVAALLVIAIHTSPLLTISPLGDFVFTRIIARIGVPFFFLVSGFFLLNNPATPALKLKKFIYNTLFLYGIAILIYLPINIYNHYFEQKQLVFVVLKDLFWNGTLYHLWYLPASIMGALLSWYFIKLIGYKKTLFVTSILYIIGLFGDSYYGFATQIPVLNQLYEGLFQLFTYTRNGLFFAPFFFTLGGFLHYTKKMPKLSTSSILFSLSLLGMIFEGLYLRKLQVQRHDSLYLFLPFVMYFLLCLLLSFRGKRIPWLKPISMVLYLIHPFLIVVIRLIAKIFKIESFLVENSIIHYISVVFTSLICAWIYYIFICFWKKKKNPVQRSWIEINLENIVYNAKILASNMPNDCSFMAVLKANAYGHGATKVAHALNQAGFDSFAVATLEEGISLRKARIHGTILILGYTNPSNAKLLHHYRLTQTILDSDYAHALNQCGYPLKVHLKIDTGMHRLGLNCTSIEEIVDLFSLFNIKICGMYTHLCTCDSQNPDDIAFTQMQIDTFYKITNQLKNYGITDLKLHLQSSSGFLNYPNLDCQYIRIGIALYGAQNTDSTLNPLASSLRPALSLKSKIALIREIDAFESVGYDRTFVATQKSRIAVLPIGYADGLPRNLSSGLQDVLVNGQRAPIIGRICMDQLMIDITNIENTQVDTIVTLIGIDGTQSICAQEMAENAKTISNELLCRMGSRLPRIYYSKAKAPVYN